MKVGDLARCVCGEEHRIQAMLFGVAVVACPHCPPTSWYMVNTDYCRRTTDVPLPPARPTFALRTLRVVPPRKPFIPPGD